MESQMVNIIFSDNGKSALGKVKIREHLIGAAPMRFMKATRHMAVITPSRNAQVCFDFWGNFLIERTFGNDIMIFQDDDPSSHRAKTVKAFLEERHTRSILWLANSVALNQAKDLCLKLKKMVNDKLESLSGKSKQTKLLEKPEVV